VTKGQSEKIISIGLPSQVDKKVAGNKKRTVVKESIKRGTEIHYKKKESYPPGGKSEQRKPKPRA